MTDIRRLTTLLVVSVIVVIGGSLSPTEGHPPTLIAPPNAIAGREFVPRAGFVRTTKALYFNQRVTQGRNAARPSYDALSGTRNIPTILLAFNNRPGQFTTSQYQSMLFDDVTQPTIIPRPTLTAYYRDVSHGKLTVGGRVLGWYTLPNDDAYYENNDFQNNVMRNGDGLPFGELLEFGLKQADAEIDFGLYDNDGPDGIANSGDDDGKVDTVFFIHPEVGAECGGEGRSNIWSHSWHYSENTYGHTGPFVTRAIRRGKDGKPILNDDGTQQHIVIDDYTIQPGLSCPDEGEPAKMIQVGVFCHEFGHALGLPDLYDRNNKSEGVGNWCVMAGGSYGGDGRSAQCPVGMCAWCKTYLGWAASETITQKDRFSLEAVEDRGRLFRINVPNTKRREYFLLEFRDNEWQDSVFHVRQNWDRFLPASGVALWHVDERVGEGPDWPFAPQGKGQNDSPSLPNAAAHSLVSLCQRDRKLDLELKKNRGDATDLLLTGDKFEDDPELKFGSRGYDGKLSRIAVTAVDLKSRNVELQPGEQIAAAVHIPAPTVPLAVVGSEAERRELPRLSEVIEKIKLGHNLTYMEHKLFEAADDFKLKEVTPLADRPEILAKAAVARTRTVGAWSTAAVGEEQDPHVMALILRQAGTTPLTVQYSADHSRAERVTGLDLPGTVASVQLDGKLRLDADLKSLIGDNIEWISRPAGDSVTNSSTRSNTGSVAEKYWQTTVFKGRTLPVFDTETTLFFTDGKLKTVKSHTFGPETLRVSGKAAGFNLTQAKAIVADQLGLFEKTVGTITECREGVFLPDENPSKARIAYRVCIPAGEGHVPIHVFIDSETREVLQVK